MVLEVVNALAGWLGSLSTERQGGGTRGYDLQTAALEFWLRDRVHDDHEADFISEQGGR